MVLDFDLYKILGLPDPEKYPQDSMANGAYKITFGKFVTYDTPTYSKISWWWEGLLAGLGGLVLAPYLWWKGKQIEQEAEKVIKIAGYIGVFIIIIFLFLMFRGIKRV